MALAEVVVDPQPTDVESDGQQPDPKAQPVVKPDPATGVKSGVDERANAGILADLKKEREQRQRIERQFQDTETRLKERDRQLQAMIGGKAPTEEDAEADAIRAKFGQLFPGLAKLSDAQIDKLLKVAENAGQLEETTNHYWAGHGKAALGSLAEKVAEEIGGELTPRQQRALRSAFTYAVESDQALLERYAAGDPKLIDEFAAEWIEDWFKPAQRRVTQQVVAGQRRVPSGRDRSVGTSAPKQINFKDPKAVEDAMVASFKEHGGQFGD